MTIKNYCEKDKVYMYKILILHYAYMEFNKDLILFRIVAAVNKKRRSVILAPQSFS